MQHALQPQARQAGKPSPPGVRPNCRTCTWSRVASHGQTGPASAPKAAAFRRPSRRTAPFPGERPSAARPHVLQSTWAYEPHVQGPPPKSRNPVRRNCDAPVLPRAPLWRRELTRHSQNWEPAAAPRGSLGAALPPASVPATDPERGARHLRSSGWLLQQPPTVVTFAPTSRRPMSRSRPVSAASPARARGPLRPCAAAQKTAQPQLRARTPQTPSAFWRRGAPMASTAVDAPEMTTPISSSRLAALCAPPARFLRPNCCHAAEAARAAPLLSVAPATIRRRICGRISPRNPPGRRNPTPRSPRVSKTAAVCHRLGRHLFPPSCGWRGNFKRGVLASPL